MSLEYELRLGLRVWVREDRPRIWGDSYRMARSGVTGYCPVEDPISPTASTLGRVTEPAGC